MYVREWCGSRGGRRLKLGIIDFYFIFSERAGVVFVFLFIFGGDDVRIGPRVSR